MKAVIPYVLMMTGTLVAAVAIVFALYSLKPGLFGVVAPQPAAAVKKDTTASAHPRVAAADTAAQGDSSAAHAPLADAKPQEGAGSLADSLQALRAAVRSRDSAIARLTGNAARQADSAAAPAAASDSARAKQSKTFAKMIESMPAEQAVRILKGLDDREVKSILLSVKKRQAAKILSALDPDRAARMIRTVQ
ncbi:MAG TPA: hypothetical protein VML00_00860 [Bacteroidota bacterium]|nr:hypothetical protein [Bacteroidota bacterium]